MEHEQTKNIIQYLTILELPLDKPITEQDVKSQYRKLVHVYHPDASVDVYQDGERFKLLQKAYEYLKEDLDYVNSLIRNNFQNNASYNSNSYGYKQEERQNTSYQTKPTNSSNFSGSGLNSLIFYQWRKTSKFHFYTAIAGIGLALLIFVFGFLPYVSRDVYTGLMSSWTTYLLYTSSADSYGVYHCAIAFNFVLIIMLIFNFLIAYFQKKADYYSLLSTVVRLVFSFLTFGLAIPQAVFHMIVIGDQMYAAPEVGAYLLMCLTWLIVILYLVKTIVTAIPFFKYIISKLK